MTQRKTVLNIPVGVPALYLLNEAGVIIDATVGGKGALRQTLAQWSKNRQRMIRPYPQDSHSENGRGIREPGCPESVTMTRGCPWCPNEWSKKKTACS